MLPFFARHGSNPGRRHEHLRGTVFNLPSGEGDRGWLDRVGAGTAASEGPGEAEQTAERRRDRPGRPLPSRCPAFCQDRAGADHVREPGAGERGRASWRGWAVPPRSQILYKQTLGEEEEAAATLEEADWKLPAYADTLSLSAGACRGNFGPAAMPARPFISPKRRQARDSRGKVAGCSRAGSGFAHGAAAGGRGEPRPGRSRRKGIPWASRPAAQARYVVGKEEEEDPAARQG